MIFTTALILSLGSLTLGSYTHRQVGAPNTMNYTLYFEENGQVISPFHDIPLFANEEKTLYNMIVEIPKWTNAKNEINKETPFNPIKQDTKDGKPRFVPNIFPYKGYIWNYGAFPQTWEDPNYISPYTNKKGDNDPIDVIEVGQSVATVGEIKQVKILGIIGLIDQDETDWKVVVIDHNDPLANNLTDIQDVEEYMPGYLNATCHIFKVYKTPGGDPPNTIAFNDTPRDRTFATSIVLETHEYWQSLMNGTTSRGEIQTINRRCNESIYVIDPKNETIPKVPKANPKPPAPVDPSNKVWYFGF
ncbi:Inorganic pyrophosphatase [Rhizopus azygosporus]|uniref:Inorganic pyrophosphatase n=2 Tax=Rhizopus TaxID=4842 RepID=A0A367IXI0_RHIAZ|nr:inorganic pyrophosphatase [Rhizopus microsporus]RCH82319.1 Inorganic pyrophosphatase [Rhizopus azygosporus]